MIITEFIFMLTHHDVTMPNALEVINYNEQEHFRGVEIALKIGADSLIEAIKIAAKLANTR